jgi:mono/diheme cytochrome c family protein
MQRKPKRTSSLVVWNLLVWISAAHLSQRIISAQSSLNAQNDQQAQIEKGRQMIGEVCVACHTNILRMVQVHKKSPQQWRDTVYSMIGRGAQVMPDEIDSVTAFLAANAGSNRQTTAQASSGSLAGRADQQTPDAEARAILQRSCQQCHDLATASTKLGSEDWNAVIAKMMTYGARLTPGDQQKLIAYLNGLAKYQ